MVSWAAVDGTADAGIVDGGSEASGVQAATNAGTAACDENSIHCGCNYCS